MKSLLIVFSYHHHNTDKIARAIANVLDAQIRTPQQIDIKELQEYGLIGFGSGIYDGKLHKSLLNLVDDLPQATDKKSFIFSTCGVPAFAFGEGYVKKYAVKAHSLVRDKLQSKGYVIVDEFICPGFNTNVFLKYFGGINKGRPNEEDFNHAEEFAKKIKQSIR